MARNVNRSKAQYKLRCFYYKPVVSDRKIIRDEKIAGIFWAKRLSQNKNPLIVGSTRKIIYTTMLETPDKINNLSVDYFVEYHGDVYRIISMDENELGQGRRNYVLTMQREVIE